MPKQQKQRKRIRVRPIPKKSEVSQLGKALRLLGGYGGGALGSMFGQPSVGAAAGSGLGAAVSKWLGQGDYSVRSNTLVTSLKPDGSIPAMHRNDQTITVRHKEFVGELRGNTTFTTAYRYPLNPGLATTFPWLHTIASQYSEYRIKGLVFHFVPTSGQSVASANTALGSVMFQTSYRATEDAPTSKLEMMNEYWASEGRPCDEICHPIECDPKENPFNIQYVRTGTLSPSENILMYDLGVTTVAVTGQQANGNVLGDIWMSYEIELKKPRLTGLNTEATRSIQQFTNSGVSQASPLGAIELKSTIDGVVATSNSLTFPANLSGEYILAWAYTSAASIAGMSLTYSGGVSNIVTTVTAVGSSSGILTTVLRLDPSAASSTLTFNVATLTGTPTTALRISEYNSGFN